MGRSGIVLFWVTNCILYNIKSSRWLMVGNFFSRGIWKASSQDWNCGFFEVQKHFATVFSVNSFPSGLPVQRCQETPLFSFTSWISLQQHKKSVSLFIEHWVKSEKGVQYIFNGIHFPCLLCDFCICAFLEEARFVLYFMSSTAVVNTWQIMQNINRLVGTVNRMRPL